MTTLQIEKFAPGDIQIDAAGDVANFVFASSQAGTLPLSTTVYLDNNGVETDYSVVGFVNFSAIGGSGEIAVSALTESGSTDVYTSYLLQNGTVTTLPSVGGNFSTLVKSIDTQGNVYGTFQFSGSTSDLVTIDSGWVYQNGSLSKLYENFTTGSGTAELTVYMSDGAGNLVGSAEINGGTASQAEHAYLWKDGQAIDLGTTSPALNTVYATGINVHDVITGVEYTAAGGFAPGAFMWANGTLTSLPVLSAADKYLYSNAINDQGIIVGYVQGGGVLTATVWVNGAAYDLNSFLPADSGWVLSTANGISDSDQVVGSGSYNGASESFELTLPTISVSAATALSQSKANSIVTAEVISDTAANIATDLDALEALATAGELASVTISDGGALGLTVAQLTADKAVLADISGPYLLGVSDSAANISSALDALQLLAKSGELGSIALTDSAALTVTAAQLTSDAAAINAISGGFTVAVNAPSIDSSITGLAGEATMVVFSGTGSQYTITPSGDGTTFIVTGNGITDQLSNVQALEFSDHTDIVAAAPGPASAVTTGNVTELYAAVLGREPDLSGLTFYQNYLKNNPSTPLQQFAEYFLSSTEYTSAHSYAQSSVGDTQFITDSYQNLLHRAPSTDEVSFYLTNVMDKAEAGLRAGTPAFAAAQFQAHALMLVYFSASAEFLGDVQVTATNPTSAQHWLVLV